MITLDTYGPDGLKATFPYNPFMVDQIKQVLGFRWDKPQKAWVAEGSEVVLDMHRLGLGYSATERARIRIAEFQWTLQRITELKAQAGEWSTEEFGYQKLGSKMLALQRRGILADDMGLGKSKQALDACQMVKARRVLIVALQTLLYNWRDEIQKWYPGCPVTVIEGGPKKREQLWEAYEQGVVIANYEILARQWPFEREWDVLIFDEAQKVKNRQTAMHQNLLRIAENSRHCWALTGTPLEIRLEELHGIMSVVRPSLFGGVTRFRAAHCITDYTGNVIGTQNGELLAERLSPWMTRRTKAQVMTQLPPKIYQPLYVELTDLEREEYKQIENNFESWLTEQGTPGEANVLTQMIRMQQYTSSPDLVTEDGHRGSKYKALLELINDWPGRVMVFTRFEQMRKRLSEWMELPERAYISGEVKKSEERNQRIKDFNEGQLGKVFVSTDAGAFGLNVTGADLIVHYDLLWNPAKMRQREDRLHRIGQKNTVHVVTMIAKDTLDAGMMYALAERQQLFDEVVEGAEETYLQKISQAQYKRLAKGQNPWAA